MQRMIVVLVVLALVGCGVESKSPEVVPETMPDSVVADTVAVDTTAH